jgi:hypothetical protein
MTWDGSEGIGIEGIGASGETVQVVAGTLVGEVEGIAGFWLGRSA